MDISSKQAPPALFGIVGWFIEEYAEGLFSREKVAFGAYFKCTPGQLIHGQMIDTYGSSEISGKLEGKKLEFTKKYIWSPISAPEKLAGAPPVTYHLVQGQDDNWSGTFTWQETNQSMTGKVHCKIFLVVEDASHTVDERHLWPKWAEREKQNAWPFLD